MCPSFHGDFGPVLELVGDFVGPSSAKRDETTKFEPHTTHTSPALQELHL